MSDKIHFNVIEEYLFNNIDDLSLKNLTLDKQEAEISTIILQLLKGSININYDNFLPLIPPKMQEVVNLRWKAINEIFNSQFEEAEELLMMALESAKTNRLEKWIRRDILLDLNNLEVAKFNKENSFIVESNRQKELKAMDKWHYRPFLDWSLENASHELLKENFNKYTDAPQTIRFGGTINTSLTKIQESFKEAISNGSYTFIHIIRERLAYILYNYGKIYKESRLIFHSLKLFMIESKIKTVEKILSSDWDELYEEIIDDPSALLNLPFLQNNRSEDIVMKCVIIENFGAYFYDEDITEINLFLRSCINQEFSMNRSFDIKRSAIKAYKDIINRIENEEIISKFSKLLIDDNHLVVNEIVKLFTRVDWKKVTNVNLENVAADIYKNAENSLLKSKVYRILANMKLAHPHLLLNIEKHMQIKWIENKDLDINNYFSIQTINGSIKKSMVVDLIEKIRVNNENMTENSSISIGGHSLFQILANHLVKQSEFPIELTDLYTKILLNPHQVASEKIECIESILRLIKFNEKFSIFAKEKLQNTMIQRNMKEILSCRNDSIFTRISKEKLELKLHELYIFLNTNEKNVNEVLAKCVEYGTHPLTEVRENTLSLVETISKNYGSLYKNDLIQFLYSKTYDNWFKIRGDSIYLLSVILEEDKSWESIVKNRMLELINDSNPYVRSSIIEAAIKKTRSNIQNENYRQMISILKRDRHYKLRDQALEK